MAEKPAVQGAKGSPAGPSAREDRLKAALKANMARRKAQVRARAAAEDGTGDAGHETPDTNE